MFGHRMETFYLRMDQVIQVYFMVNPDLAGNGPGLHHGKINTFYFCMFIFGTCGVVFNKGIGGLVFYFHILVFQYFIKRESTFKILNIFYYYFYHFAIFFFKYIVFSHKHLYINFC